ncbi:late embryogenesis abundant protein [Gossypium australe]|uniref:Late embryogenesis abundant protein n=1 Tax=Gossypium australe TaxID=47621 RepID=A0A5B6UR11_9ROSI|nr:late embryogenesis abundant protein [Gossypium australe]
MAEKISDETPNPEKINDESPNPEKINDESPNPLAPSNDEESITAHSKDQNRKKQMKCLLYVILFTVFQTGIILIFVLIFMRMTNPKFRVRSGSFIDAFNVGTEASPSFDLRMNTQFTVKNTNFGHFKYKDGTVTFAYKGIPVGNAMIEKGRVGARSTKKVDVVVKLRSNGLLLNTRENELGSDISSGVLPLTSSIKLKGKIHLMEVIKKKKYAQMNCSMEIDINSRTLGNIICK